MRTMLLICIAVLSVAACAPAAEITGVTMPAYSSEDIALGMYADNLVSSYGINPNGEGTHSILYPDQWMSAGTDPNSEYLVFDLGASYNIKRLKIWNWNWTAVPERSVKTFKLLVSATDSNFDNPANYTDLGTFGPLTQGPQNDTTVYADYVVITATTFRYAKLLNFTTFGGATTKTALAKVRFFDDLDNLSPTANAGANGGIRQGDTFSLNGTVTDDSYPGNPVTVTWTKDSGQGTVTFTPPNAVDCNATFSVDGTYVLKLKASDTQYSASDTVQIKVLPAAYQQLDTSGWTIEASSTWPGMNASSLITTSLSGLRFYVLEQEEKTEIKVAQVKVYATVGDMEGNYNLLMEVLGQIEEADKVDVVVVPEDFLDGCSVIEDDIGREDLVNFAIDAETSPYIKGMQEWAERNKAWLICGFIRKDANDIRPSAAIINRQGELIDCYDKTHLAGVDLKYGCKGGKRLDVYDSDFGKFGVMICADRRWPQTSRTLTDKGAKIIFNPTYGMSGDLNLAMMRTRAYENGIYICFTHPRQSLITGPDGQVITNNEDPAKNFTITQIDISKSRGVEDIHIAYERDDIYSRRVFDPCGLYGIRVNGLYGTRVGAVPDRGRFYWNAPPASYPVADQWLLIDLGAPYDLNYLRLWNLYHTNPQHLVWALQDFKVWVSDLNNPVSFVQVGGLFTLQQWPADQLQMDSSEWFDIDTTTAFPGGVRYLKIDVESNWGTDYTGLSDIRVSGFLNPHNCQGVVNSGYTLQLDLNGDCRVDFKDFAEFVQDWLRCNEPTDPTCEKSWWL